MADQRDPRIAELLDLATTEARPLAVQPTMICALEDAGWMVDPFTGAVEREDSLYLPAGDALRNLAHALNICELAGGTL